MRCLFHFIVSHSIFIAFCAAALSFQTGQLIGVAVNRYLLSFIFFGVLTGYNAYWLISRYSFSSNHSLRSLFATTPYSFLVLFLAFVGMLFCFTQLHWLWSNLVLSGIFFALYLLPILPFKQLEWIWRLGFLKTVLLAFFLGNNNYPCPFAGSNMVNGGFGEFAFYWSIFIYAFVVYHL